MPNVMEAYSDEEIRGLLRDKIQEVGSMRKLAASWKITPATICKMAAPDGRVYPIVADLLGLIAQRVYVRK